MEITKIFKACVKAAKLQNKDCSFNNILPKSKNRNRNSEKSFHAKAIDVLQNISKLRQFLLTHQAEYIGEFSHLLSISSKMSKDERDQIDVDAQAFIKSCSNTIFSLKAEVNRISTDTQLKCHYLAVVELLDLYLKDICKLYSQQRAYRVKQTVDRKRMSRLKPEKKPMLQSNEQSKVTQSLHAERAETIHKKKNTEVNRIKTEEKVSHDFLFSEEKAKEEFHFSPEETQMFEEENERLYEEMNNVDKEVKNIEGKVIEIGQLQEIFQEKVLSQSTQIEGVYETAVSTTENVKDGNEQIREAIKNSATFRVWILFFLVMCTFSLLFLDWYNV